MGKIFKIIIAGGIFSMIIMYMVFGLYLNWKNEEKIQAIEAQLISKQRKKDELYLELKNAEYVRKSLLTELALEKEKKRQRELIKELMAIEAGTSADAAIVSASKPLPTISGTKTTTTKTTTTTKPTTTTPKKKTRAS